MKRCFTFLTHFQGSSPICLKRCATALRPTVRQHPCKYVLTVFPPPPVLVGWACSPQQWTSTPSSVHTAAWSLTGPENAKTSAGIPNTSHTVEHVFKFFCAIMSRMPTWPTSPFVFDSIVKWVPFMFVSQLILPCGVTFRWQSKHSVFYLNCLFIIYDTCSRCIKHSRQHNNFFLFFN